MSDEEHVGMPDLSTWRVETMVLAHSRKLIARKWGVTYIYNEQPEGSWLVTKIRGGRVIAERTFESAPRNIVDFIPQNRRRRKAAA